MCANADAGNWPGAAGHSCAGLWTRTVDGGKATKDKKGLEAALADEGRNEPFEVGKAAKGRLGMESANAANTTKEIHDVA